MCSGERQRLRCVQCIFQAGLAGSICVHHRMVCNGFLCAASTATCVVLLSLACCWFLLQVLFGHAFTYWHMTVSCRCNSFPRTLKPCRDVSAAYENLNVYERSAHTTPFQSNISTLTILHQYVSVTCISHSEHHSQSDAAVYVKDILLLPSSFCSHLLVTSSVPWVRLHASAFHSLPGFDM